MASRTNSRDVMTARVMIMRYRESPKDGCLQYWKWHLIALLNYMSRSNPTHLGIMKNTLNLRGVNLPDSSQVLEMFERLRKRVDNLVTPPVNDSKTPRKRKRVPKDLMIAAFYDHPETWSYPSYWNKHLSCLINYCSRDDEEDLKKMRGLIQKVEDGDLVLPLDREVRNAFNSLKKRVDLHFFRPARGKKNPQGIRKRRKIDHYRRGGKQQQQKKKKKKKISPQKARFNARDILTKREKAAFDNYSTYERECKEIFKYLVQDAFNVSLVVNHPKFSKYYDLLSLDAKSAIPENSGEGSDVPLPPSGTWMNHIDVAIPLLRLNDDVFDFVLKIFEDDKDMIIGAKEKRNDPFLIKLVLDSLNNFFQMLRTFLISSFTDARTLSNYKYKDITSLYIGWPTVLGLCALGFVHEENLEHPTEYRNVKVGMDDGKNVFKKVARRKREFKYQFSLNHHLWKERVRCVAPSLKKRSTTFLWGCGVFLNTSTRFLRIITKYETLDADGRLFCRFRGQKEHKGDSTTRNVIENQVKEAQRKRPKIVPAQENVDADEDIFFVGGQTSLDSL